MVFNAPLCLLDVQIGSTFTHSPSQHQHHIMSLLIAALFIVPWWPVTAGATYTPWSLQFFPVLWMYEVSPWLNCELHSAGIRIHLCLTCWIGGMFQELTPKIISQVSRFYQHTEQRLWSLEYLYKPAWHVAYVTVKLPTSMVVAMVTLVSQSIAYWV